MATEPAVRSPGRKFLPLPAWTGPSTRLVHGGRRPERNAGSVVPPIYQTTTFHYPPALSESAERGGPYLYTRMENPSQEAAAEPIRLLEGAESARVLASGMGAISCTLLSVLRSGDEVAALSTLYGGTIDLFTEVFPRLGLRVRWIDDAAAADPERAVGGSARAVFLETPTNPLMQVHDLARWAKAADAIGALLIVDNTFATPVNQTPLALGADLVVHSATKYLSGHADVIAGAVAGPARLVDRVASLATNLGAPLDPFAAFLLARGLKTLAIRVARQNENALRVAEAFREHPAVRRVLYPGWASPEEEAIARRQMTGRGGMLGLSLSGGIDAAHAFLRRLRFIHPASSLGGVESLASLPAETSHRHLSPEERRARGIDDGLVRLSLGIEDADDLVRDIREALPPG
ncbi:MAG TPA: aminotransferase class I/II-fold pyridoxal phosphate-dependent enzyme [Thermoplasmata archaeon]|nr:aminotransferase class I/II-fold pyridoxal phosphate-dependent enzyme [Thermoplasmata archaeon]